MLSTDCALLHIFLKYDHISYIYMMTKLFQLVNDLKIWADMKIITYTVPSYKCKNV